jgi:cellulose synthase/poly-beta-1,6-N-acetylglucosamine synthase-like glycosyltransferase
VVDRLVEAICKLDYPKDKLDIQLLDDSTDETTQVADSVVQRYAALGHPITYIHRTNREGFKAGALQNGMTTAKGEFIAIFDADFVPPEDWLLRVIHHFAEPQIGMVQTRWTHLNRNYSFLTEVEAILLDGHFVLEHSGRARSGVFFNFNGTAGMWRRQAIVDAGGWQHDTLTEDTDLSYRSQLAGWKFKYLQDIECPAELPIEMTAFKTQQARWAKGLIQTAKKVLPKVLKSKAPWRVKVEAWYHLTANISYPLMIVLSTLLMPAMIIRSFGGWFQMPLGIGLTLTNTKAVLEALLGVKSPFARTPKYRVQSKADKVMGQKYRRRLGLIPWLELLVGSYFVVMCTYAFTSGNYWTIPFLLLFVIGYWYTGLMSLLQGRFDRLSLGREAHTKPFPVGV